LIGLQLGDALHRDFVVAKHPDLLAQFAEVLHQVEGEAVVVVDHQQHMRSIPIDFIGCLAGASTIRYPL
jgi:hypothetical protein